MKKKCECRFVMPVSDPISQCDIPIKVPARCTNCGKRVEGIEFLINAEKSAPNHGPLLPGAMTHRACKEHEGERYGECLACLLSEREAQIGVMGKALENAAKGFEDIRGGWGDAGTDDRSYEDSLDEIRAHADKHGALIDTAREATPAACLDEVLAEAKANVRSELVTKVLGKNHVIYYHAGSIDRWLDDPNMDVRKTARHIQAYSRLIHRSLTKPRERMGDIERRAAEKRDATALRQKAGEKKGDG